MIQRCLIAIAAVLALSSCEPSDVWVIRIGSHVPEQSVGIRTVIKPWIEAVEQQLPPNIRFQTYWGGSLGRDAFIQYDLVRHGVLDIAWVIPSYTPGQFPQMDVLELPFLANNALETSVVGWRMEEAGLIQGTERVKVLGIWTTDIASLQTREVVTDISQLENFKIRSAGAVHASFIKALGANPETMSAPEMNEALQRGAIDGVLQAWSGIRTYRSDKLMNSSLEGPFGALPFMLVMNRASFERLPKPVQKIFMDQGGEYLARRAGQAYDQIVSDIIDEIEAEGRYTIVPPDPELITNYRQQYAFLHEDWINDTHNGAEVYALALKVIEEIRAEDE